MPWSCDLSTLMEVVALNQCLAGLLPLLRHCPCLLLGRRWLLEARTSLADSCISIRGVEKYEEGDYQGAIADWTPRR